MTIATAWFHDVGQGQCSTIVDEGGNEAIVIDCGYGSRRSVTSPLAGRNLRMVLVTHLDIDHFGDVMKIVRDFEPDVVRLNLDTSWKSDSEAPQLLTLLRGLRDWHRSVGGGQVLSAKPEDDLSYHSIPGVECTVLAPDQADLIHAHAVGDRNPASVVMRVDVGEAAVLYTGDTTDEVLRRIADSQPAALDADVLVVPHHGGAWQSTPSEMSLTGLYELVSPEVSIFSVGASNRYGHPRIESIREPSSRPSVRVMCTQVTSTCHAEPTEMTGTGCAGTVKVAFLGQGQLAVEPDDARHASRILGWSRPRCIPFATLDSKNP